ncbi:MAG: hypothetical protein Ta2E_07980 [Mycoplasmoidaceae bacterium]|nr:MAG: hypothetical protein Ta2E_07980 [Mycoplasmoidaceae bacterium]
MIIDIVRNEYSTYNQSYLERVPKMLGSIVLIDSKPFGVGVKFTFSVNYNGERHRVSIIANSNGDIYCTCVCEEFERADKCIHIVACLAYLLSHPEICNKYDKYSSNQSTNSYSNTINSYKRKLKLAIESKNDDDISICMLDLIKLDDIILSEAIEGLEMIKLYDLKFFNSKVLDYIKFAKDRSIVLELLFIYKKYDIFFLVWFKANSDVLIKTIKSGVIDMKVFKKDDENKKFLSMFFATLVEKCEYELFHVELNKLINNKDIPFIFTITTIRNAITNTFIEKEEFAIFMGILNSSINEYNKNARVKVYIIE